MSILSANMGLIISSIGSDSGLAWEQNLNASEYTIDAHNHTSGNGVPVPSAGLNINAPLAFNNQQATGLQAVTFTPQVSLSTLYGIYSIGVDLYYNDGNGNVIQITSGGTVNATSSGISSGTNTASFVSNVLIVNSATNHPANIQVASVLLGNNTTNSKYLTLSPPSAMGANIQETLPAIPGTPGFMTMDASGNMGASTIPLANGITRSNLAAVGQQVSSSSGVYVSSATSYTAITNLSVTITTSGRPVMLIIQSDNSSSSHLFEFGVSNSSSQSDSAGNYKWLRGSTPIAYNYVQGYVYLSDIIPAPMMFLDTPSAGTYTYTIQAAAISGNPGSEIISTYAVLLAYEL